MKTHFTHWSCSKQLQTPYLLQLFQKIDSQKISLNSRIQFQFFLKTFQKNSDVFHSLQNISFTIISKVISLYFFQEIDCSSFENYFSISDFIHFNIHVSLVSKNQIPLIQKCISLILTKLFHSFQKSDFTHSNKRISLVSKVIFNSFQNGWFQ